MLKKIFKKIDMVKILYCTETATYIQFIAQYYQKYASNKKKTSKIKRVQNWIPYKKVLERICLSPPEVELGAPRKIDTVEILFCTETAKYI